MPHRAGWGRLPAAAGLRCTLSRCPLRRVSTIQSGRGVTLRRPDGTQQPLSARGYDHFRTHADDTTEAPDAEADTAQRNRCRVSLRLT